MDDKKRLSKLNLSHNLTGSFEIFIIIFIFYLFLYKLTQSHKKLSVF